jgi:hypothetical protein
MSGTDLKELEEDQIRAPLAGQDDLKAGHSHKRTH